MFRFCFPGGAVPGFRISSPRGWRSYGPGEWKGSIDVTEGGDADSGDGMLVHLRNRQLRIQRGEECSDQE